MLDMKGIKKPIAYSVLTAGLLTGAYHFDFRLPSASASEIWTTQNTGAQETTSKVALFGPKSASQTSQAPQAAPPPQQIDIAALNYAFTSLAERLSPAVVNIYTKTGMSGPQRQQLFPGFPDDDFDFFFQDPFSRERTRGRGGQPQGQQMPQAQALGSGFVINQDGYIVTNSHVVRMAGRNADEIMVKFIGEENGNGHLAKIVGVDEVTDVALLKLVEKKADLRVAPLGDSDRSKVGEWVVAIGNPYGHTHTLTQGVVSAVGRSLEGMRSDFLQTSASINPGNSGGPLFNLAGEVIGINTAIDPRAQGIGFAIPVNTAKNVISQLVSQGKVTRGWLGIKIQDLSEDIAGYMKLKEPEGVLIREVVPNAPAARAGLEEFDVIRKVNGQTVQNSRELLRQLDKVGVGQSAQIEFLRNGQSKKVEVRITEQPQQS